jgi:protease IV
MSFFKTFFAALLAIVAFCFISFILFIGIISGLASDKEIIVKDKSVLYLNLDAQISEQQAEDPFEGLPVLGGNVNKIGLLQLKQTIEEAKADPKIEGIYVTISFPQAGFSTIQEIRQSLIDFKSSGKWVIAYADAMSEKAYYLASAADKVYLNPEGDVEFNGLAVEMTFFKRMFDKLEIKPQIFRVGEFKSAVEPYMLEKMSPENKLQITEMINSIYDVVLTHVAESRAIEKSRLKEISNKMLVQNSDQAVEVGLVDSLLYYDQLLNELRNRLSISETSKINFIKYKQYRKSLAPKYGTSTNEVAVIVADGTIMPGRSEDGIVGSKTLTDEIRKARESNRVKAIVIRINSPGGSFQASDMMWREITLAAKEKPVIASMSNVAASGGYYMAMGCDTIVAQSHTITGSIGVFSILYDASGLLNNKLGITTEEIKTGEYGEMITLSRPLTEIERNFWQRKTNAIYETFTTKAADGRNLKVEDLKRVASGRVWTGEQAKARGLVDILGTYNDAIRIAAEAAGVQDDYKVKLYPREKTFFQTLMEGFEDNAKLSLLKNEMGEYYPYYQYWQRVKSLQGTQALMPYEFQID